MNNEQFRKLLSAQSGQNGGAESKSHLSGVSRSASFGSRQRNSMPMTPRNVPGAHASFAHQAATSNSQRPGKQFRSVAPKGSKLGAGYRDRTQDRVDDSEDEKAKRIKALEES